MHKLKAIPEVEEMKDVSSSEKPRLKGQKLCETIIEEKDRFDDEDVDEEGISDSSMNSA